MKIWYLMCIVFFFYCIKLLEREMEEIIYVMENRTEPYKYLVCHHLDEVTEKLSIRNQMDLTEFNLKLINYYETLKQNANDEKKRRVIETYPLNSSRSRTYLLLNFHLCHLVNEMNALGYYGGFEDKKFYVYNLETNTGTILRDSNQQIYQLIVSHMESHCQLFDRRNNRTYHRFVCLNDCFKGEKRSSKYMYNGDEEGNVILNYSMDELMESEKACSNECKEYGCLLIDLSTNYEDFDTNTTAFAAKFLISQFDYWTQLIGLICLIFAISFFQIISKLIALVNSRTEHPKVKKYSPHFKITILLATIGCLLALCVLIVMNYNEKLNSPTKNKLKTYPYELEPFSLFLCTEIKDFMNKKFSHLEIATNVELDQIIDEVYLGICLS